LLTLLNCRQCKTRYEYDRVFAQTSSQEEVFEAVQPLCVSVLDGYNVCIFAYGQTGSGKTFTMEGSTMNKGVSPRAIAELLAQIEQTKDQYTYTVTLSMLEIYNETILDLLPVNPNVKEKEKLDIRQTPDGNQVVGLNETAVSSVATREVYCLLITHLPMARDNAVIYNAPQITSMAQVEELMRQGQKNRAVGSHDMNEHSSRSHSIITVTCRGKNLLDGSTTYGKAGCIFHLHNAWLIFGASGATQCAR
jgi:kinesin family protein C2/C3